MRDPLYRSRIGCTATAWTRNPASPRSTTRARVTQALWTGVGGSHTINEVRTIESFSTSGAASRLKAIRELLDVAFGGKFSDEDWLHTLGGWHVVIVDSGHVVAHGAVVARTLQVEGRLFRTGYVEGVATLPERRGEGLGSLAMSELMHVIEEGYEFGALSTGRHRFYERLGWERWRGPTFVRQGGTLVRTKHEDDGVMVLRFGASAGVDLTAAISCEARSGDDW